MAGGATNYQMTQNAKVRTMVRHLVDLTTANKILIGSFAECDIAIKSVRVRVEVIMDDDNSVIVGHGVMDGSGDVPDDNSIVEAQNIPDTTAVGALVTLTLASTLKNANIKEARGLPIVPKGLPIYIEVDAVPTTGAGTVIIDYFPLDENAD
jgi:hypothetical protein